MFSVQSVLLMASIESLMKIKFELFVIRASLSLARTHWWITGNINNQ